MLSESETLAICRIVTTDEYYRGICVGSVESIDQWSPKLMAGRYSECLEGEFNDKETERRHSGVQVHGQGSQ